MNAVGYTRVSTRRQGESGLGLDAQRSKIEDLCASKGYSLVEVLTDTGFSGRNDRRPEFRRMMAMARSSEIQVLAIAKLDRLTRSIEDLARMLDTLGKYGVSLISASEALDTSTATGRMLVNMVGVFAQWEREINAERTRDAMAARRAQGKKIGAVPFGFSEDAEGKLVHNAREREMFEQLSLMRLEGVSYQKIGEELREQGFLNRRGVPYTRGALRWLWITHPEGLSDE